MPIGWYQSLLGRCLLSSRAYTVLKNSVIDHVPSESRDGNVVEILCGAEDAKLIVDLADRMASGTAYRTEHSIHLRLEPAVGAAAAAASIDRPIASEYRMKPSGDTWHFRTNFSQLPNEDYVAAEECPDSGQLCNECIVKEQHGERD